MIFPLADRHSVSRQGIIFIRDKQCFQIIISSCSATTPLQLAHTSHHLSCARSTAEQSARMTRENKIAYQLCRSVWTLQNLFTLTLTRLAECYQLTQSCCGRKFESYGPRYITHTQNKRAERNFGETCVWQNK